MLKHISIKKLFHLYDYEIEMTSNDGNPIKNIMFLTGPNGMGKSTILRSVASVYKRQFSYFSLFPFESMWFDFDTCGVEISQTTQYKDVDEDSDASADKIVTVKCDYFTKGKQPISEHGEWCYIDGVKGTIADNMPNMEMYFNAQKCLYISDHRLVENYDDAVVGPHLVIEVLRNIQAAFSEGYSAQMDSSTIAESAKTVKINSIKPLLKLLYDCDITLPFDIKLFDDNSVSDYQIACCENAIKNCGDLISKLQGFYQFVDNSKFLGKTFRITINSGLQFYTINEDRSMLGFNQLSLGERHIISQIYSMFFSPIPYKLVLIDEPELSFHLMWQQQYLGNIKKVQALRQCAFLIATHSTQVFEGKFELTTDLFEQNEKLFD